MLSRHLGSIEIQIGQNHTGPIYKSYRTNLNMKDWKMIESRTRDVFLVCLQMYSDVLCSSAVVQFHKDQSLYFPGYFPTKLNIIRIGSWYISEPQNTFILFQLENCHWIYLIQLERGMCKSKVSVPQFLLYFFLFMATWDMLQNECFSILHFLPWTGLLHHVLRVVRLDWSSFLIFIMESH